MCQSVERVHLEWRVCLDEAMHLRRHLGRWDAAPKDVYWCQAVRWLLDKYGFIHSARGI